MTLRTAAFALGLFALGVLQVALAAEPLNAVGFPKKGDPGGGVGAIRIWHADGAWHLRSSTENSVGKKDKLMVFSGSVRCEDKVTVEGARLEKGNGKTSDSVTPHADGKGFDFRFATYGSVDQADFKVTDRAKTLTFKLLIDGEKAQTHRVIIGEDGGHPEKPDFTLPAHPKKK